MSTPESMGKSDQPVRPEETPELQIITPTSEEKEMDIRSTWPEIRDIPDEKPVPGQESPNKEKPTLH